jgi:hypothetical protein
MKMSNNKLVNISKVYSLELRTGLESLNKLKNKISEKGMKKKTTKKTIKIGAGFFLILLLLLLIIYL